MIDGFPSRMSSSRNRNFKSMLGLFCRTAKTLLMFVSLAALVFGSQLIPGISLRSSLSTIRANAVPSENSISLLAFQSISFRNSPIPICRSHSLTFSGWPKEKFLEMEEPLSLSAWELLRINSSCFPFSGFVSSGFLCTWRSLSLWEWLLPLWGKATLSP